MDKNGKRTPLEIFKYEHNKDGTTIWIVNDRNKKGIFGNGTSGQYGNTGDLKAAQYQEFIVTSYNQLDRFHTKQYQKNFIDRINKLTGLNIGDY